MVKFDYFPSGSGFRETGLRSVGLPPKPRWPHFIGKKLWWEVYMAMTVLRRVAGFNRDQLLDQ